MRAIQWATIIAGLFTFAVAAATPKPGASIEVRVDGATVVASYTLPRPTTALTFAREDKAGHRAKLWTATDNRFELVVDGGTEVVRRRDGAPFALISFRMPARYVSLEKDYAPFSPFGDGGLLIHSGRFHVCAERCDDEAEHMWSVTFIAPPGQHVIQGGRVHERRVTFDDEGSGTNVYIGRADPIETPHVVAVIDDTFPTRSREMLVTLFPRMMEYFAARLVALDRKPMLFASNDERHPGGGFGAQGGVLPNQVFIHLYGAPHGDREGTEFARGLSHFFAHEAAHLYQRIGEPSPSESWIHEGGADAMAALAMLELGLESGAEVKARLHKAASKCGKALTEGSMATFADRSRFEDYYACGFVLQIAVDGEARAATDGECDLFCVWRRFGVSVRGGAPWETLTYAKTVRDVAGDTLAEQMTRLQDGPVAGSTLPLEVALSAVDTRAREEDSPVAQRQ